MYYKTRRIIEWIREKNRKMKGCFNFHLEYLKNMYMLFIYRALTTIDYKILIDKIKVPYKF